MKMEPLWHFLDVALDVAAREPLWLDVADVFMAAEDFCEFMKVPSDTIPSHHKEMFAMREHGFIAQAKHPYYTSAKWLKAHPVPLVAELQVDMESVLYKFEDFLRGQNKYQCVLNDLYREWIINRKDFYVIYNADGVPCGRAVTWKEADASCEAQPLYTWDVEEDKAYASLIVMTVDDIKIWRVANPNGTT